MYWLKIDCSIRIWHMKAIVTSHFYWHWSYRLIGSFQASFTTIEWIIVPHCVSFGLVYLYIINTDWWSKPGPKQRLFQGHVSRVGYPVEVHRPSKRNVLGRNVRHNSCPVNPLNHTAKDFSVKVFPFFKKRKWLKTNRVYCVYFVSSSVGQ